MQRENASNTLIGKSIKKIYSCWITHKRKGKKMYSQKSNGKQKGIKHGSVLVNSPLCLDTGPIYIMSKKNNKRCLIQARKVGLI